MSRSIAPEPAMRNTLDLVAQLDPLIDESFDALKRSYRTCVKELIQGIANDNMDHSRCTTPEQELKQADYAINSVTSFKSQMSSNFISVNHDLVRRLIDTVNLSNAHVVTATTEAGMDADDLSSWDELRLQITQDEACRDWDGKPLLEKVFTRPYVPFSESDSIEALAELSKMFPRLSSELLGHAPDEILTFDKICRLGMELREASTPIPFHLLEDVIRRWAMFTTERGRQNEYDEGATVDGTSLAKLVETAALAATQQNSAKLTLTSDESLTDTSPAEARQQALSLTGAGETFSQQQPPEPVEAKDIFTPAKQREGSGSCIASTNLASQNIPFRPRKRSVPSAENDGSVETAGKRQATRDIREVHEPEQSGSGKTRTLNLKSGAKAIAQLKQRASVKKGNAKSIQVAMKQKEEEAVRKVEARDTDLTAVLTSTFDDSLKSPTKYLESRAKDLLRRGLSRVESMDPGDPAKTRDVKFLLIAGLAEFKAQVDESLTWMRDNLISDYVRTAALVTEQVAAGLSPGALAETSRLWQVVRRNRRQDMVNERNAGTRGIAGTKLRWLMCKPFKNMSLHDATNAWYAVRSLYSADHVAPYLTLQKLFLLGAAIRDRDIVVPENMLTDVLRRWDAEVIGGPSESVLRISDYGHKLVHVLHEVRNFAKITSKKDDEQAREKKWVATRPGPSKIISLKFRKWDRVQQYRKSPLRYGLGNW